MGTQVPSLAVFFWGFGVLSLSVSFLIGFLIPLILHATANHLLETGARDLPC